MELFLNIKERGHVCDKLFLTLSSPRGLTNAVLWCVASCCAFRREPKLLRPANAISSMKPAEAKEFIYIFLFSIINSSIHEPSKVHLVPPEAPLGKGDEMENIECNTTLS